MSFQPGAPAIARRHRLTEIDALRGLAALAVLAFHFTARYDEVYHFVGTVPLRVPWGYLGVNLFFVISGFVIFMTLERTRVPMDFVVSRVSRLYPAYWAAVALTFCVTTLLGLPGREVRWTTALANAPMFHQLFGVTLVDGVYWTLLVELLFYVLAFGLLLAGRLQQVLVALWALFALRVVYWATETLLHVDLPWRIRQLLILDYIPFFALGIVAFRLLERRAAPARAEWATAAMALAVLALVESPFLAVVGALCFLGVWLAAAGRLPLLATRPLVWLGTISFPLYLLHENIGWAVIRRLQLRDWSPLAAQAIALVAVLLLATLVSRTIEYPAMAWIRRRWRLRAEMRARDAPT